MKKLSLAALGLLIIGGLVGCSLTQTAKPVKEKSEKPTIMASFYPVYEFTKEVVGNEATVKLLVPAGVEPHDYEPSAKDMAAIAEAEGLVYQSPEMETWIKKVAASLPESVPLIKAAEGISLATSQGGEEESDSHHHERGAHDDEGEQLDPHIWLDPQLAQQEVTRIAKELSQIMPDKATIFQENAKKYNAKLAKLDQTFEGTLSGKKQRTVVTQHQAFGYLAKRYQLEQVAVAGLTPDAEPSPKRIGELKTIVQSQDISTIFFEENASSKVAETLSKEAGLSIGVLNTLESVSEADQAAGKNYISIMTENLKALDAALK